MSKYPIEFVVYAIQAGYLYRTPPVPPKAVRVGQITLPPSEELTPIKIGKWHRAIMETFKEFYPELEVHQDNGVILKDHPGYIMPIQYPKD